MTLSSGPNCSASCVTYSLVISHTLSWSPASAMTFPEMGSHSSGMRSSTRLPRDPALMACSVATAAVATASNRLSGSSSSSCASSPSSLTRPRISSFAGEGVSGASPEASPPDAPAASPIFVNVPAATRTERAGRARGQPITRGARHDARTIEAGMTQATIELRCAPMRWGMARDAVLEGDKNCRIRQLARAIVHTADSYR